MNRSSVLILTAILSGCKNTSQENSQSHQDDKEQIVYGDKFPKVIAVEATHQQENTWIFNVTLSSTYDSPKRYADAWRVLDSDSKELGIRKLGHDHENEQPFTRSGLINIPTGLTTVYVEGRDQANGWSKQRFEVKINEASQ